MKPISTSLYHRILFPENPGSRRHPLLILLHGRGADEEDLLGLAPALDDRLLIVSPRAPFPFSSGGGYAWYDVGEIGSPEPIMFKTSYEKLVTFLDDVIAGYPVDPSRVFLLGFSMGAVMTYALALTHPEKIRGAAANSGYLPEPPPVRYRWKELHGTEFFITHGLQDPVIPIVMARRARDLFAHANAKLTYKEYPMAHQISEESLRDEIHWMAPFLGD